MFITCESKPLTPMVSVVLLVSVMTKQYGLRVEKALATRIDYLAQQEVSTASTILRQCALLALPTLEARVIRQPITKMKRR